MLSWILSFIGALATSFTLVKVGFWSAHPVWTVIFSILAFFIVTLIINLILKKKLEAAFNVVQEKIMASQQIINNKIRAIGMRATPKFQKEIENDQAKAIREAINLLDTLKPYEKWNFMVKKQTDTLRAQFHFQLKDFDMADKYFKNALFMDPLTMAMQMTRFYKKNDMKNLEKCFKKGTSRFKDEKGVLIYALYSWILVQQNKIDEAIQILVQAKTRAEHDVLKQNWDHLVNGRIKRFSNAG
ncbi:MAG: hypothetical protein IKR81_15520, partial [Victivallales bacterium]|nr:hypothetical protein [Victivallales bacterium]